MTRFGKISPFGQLFRLSGYLFKNSHKKFQCLWQVLAKKISFSSLPVRDSQQRDQIRRNFTHFGKIIKSIWLFLSVVE